MAVKITKPEINVREKLAELDKPSGIAGEEMLRADTPQEQFNLIGAGRKNLIINGDMRVDQRNGGASINIAGSAYYIVDRMSSFKSAPSGSITGQQSTLGNLKSYKMTTSTAVTSFSGTERVHALIHVIESQNVFFANGKTVTLSFKVETNWSGNLSVRLGNHNWTRTYIVNAEVVAGVNDVAISVPLESNTIVANDNSAGLVIEIGTNAQGSLQTSTEGSWIAGDDRNLTSSTQWMLTAGTYINLTALQLEVGNVATPFEHRSYGEELALCQRYYQKFFDEPSATAQVQLIGIASGVGHFVWWPPVEMRARPTVGITDTTPYWESMPWYAVGTSLTVSSISNGHMGRSGGEIAVYGSYNPALVRGTNYSMTAEVLYWDAEL
jgi:hypothetical protein